MSGAIYYRSGRFEVTEYLLKTPRKTYAIAHIENVSVERPLLYFLVPPALGLIGFAAIFQRYLYASEIAALAVAFALALAAALIFGCLQVHSLALRGEEVALTYGLVRQLREVRDAAAEAMVAHEKRRRRDDVT
ncbi:hypothetical protein GN330_12175 [Nitratireductor sp. CAU 1489]|uniref:Uncharacterized protein n=1 Tax=Nitratireductor arenosus TaxID=2682096 RepID=A0A844QJ97_9HYPH|nr:hypothetical protein [Nitratireductor arenosus]MVA98001.1 hypothetical protein [Nitratireductor arenosus]